MTEPLNFFSREPLCDLGMDCREAIYERERKISQLECEVLQLRGKINDYLLEQNDLLRELEFLRKSVLENYKN